MDNKDEVINHLHIIHAFANMAYEDLHEQMFKYMSDWTNDAIKLLKDQEPLVIHKCGFTATCPECNLSWMMWQPDYMRYCPYCGKAVKWE